VGAQVSQQIRIQLAVLQLDALGCLAEGILVLGPLEGARVQCLLALQLNLASAARLDLLWCQNELLHD